MNDSRGQFVDSGQELATRGCFTATLGDLDGDGDLDAYVACTEADSVWKMMAQVFLPTQASAWVVRLQWPPP